QEHAGSVHDQAGGRSQGRVDDRLDAVDDALDDPVFHQLRILQRRDRVLQPADALLERLDRLGGRVVVVLGGGTEPVGTHRRAHAREGGRSGEKRRERMGPEEDGGGGAGGGGVKGRGRGRGWGEGRPARPPGGAGRPALTRTPTWRRST